MGSQYKFTIWQITLHVQSKRSILCTGQTLFKMLQSLTLPIHLSTCIHKQEMSKLSATSTSLNWSFDFIAGLLCSIPLSEQSSCTAKPLSVISSCPLWTKSKALHEFVISESNIEPGKKSLKISPPTWGAIPTYAFAVVVFCNLKMLGCLFQSWMSLLAWILCSHQFDLLSYAQYHWTSLAPFS